MSDPRLTPANSRVAKRGLIEVPFGVTLVDGTPHTVSAEVADLCSAPSGPRTRQLLRGEEVLVLETVDGWSFAESASGYVGYLAQEDRGEAVDVTHFVSTASTHGYVEEGFKGATQTSLPFGARVVVLDERRKFFETDAGFVPKGHLRPIENPMSDPVTAAQMFFGVPYLWGGNSTRGIDCSGLISAAFAACGSIVPGDSDLQCESLGSLLGSGKTPMRGDLMFWDGHVGLMVDEDVMLHANAHHMACRYEPLEQAKLRIEAQGDGAMIAHKRV